MGALSLSDAFEIGTHVLNTSVSSETKKITAQTGSVVGQGQTESDNVEWWQHVGFASRPAKAVPGKESAQAVVIRQGNTDAAIASQDLRGLELYGALGEGETCVYAIGPQGTAQARVLLKGDGSINLYTVQGNAKGGKGMGVFIRQDGSIDLLSHTGAAIQIGTDGAVKVFNGSAALQLKADGKASLSGDSQLALSAGSVAIGGPAGLPVAIGPNVVTAITALQTEIAAVAAALVACMNIVGPIIPAHATAAAAATTAVGVGTALVSAANAIIPSKRTTSD